MYTLTLSSPEDSNGLGDPTRVAPVTSTASMSAPGVLLELPPWSFVMRTSTRLCLEHALSLSLSLSGNPISQMGCKPAMIEPTFELRILSQYTQVTESPYIMSARGQLQGVGGARRTVALRPAASLTL